jgi:hypothetical protein
VGGGQFWCAIPPLQLNFGHQYAFDVFGEFQGLKCFQLAERADSGKL